MTAALIFLRNHFHPLYNLRKFTVFQWLTRLADVPIAISFPSIPHKVFVSFSKNLAWVLTRGQCAEEKERENFVRRVRVANFERMIDVGANIGLYGFLFRAIQPSASVTFVEPDCRNAALIRRTIKAQPLGGFTVIEAAVSDQPGTLMFHVDDLTGAIGTIESGTSYLRHHGKAPKTHTVSCVRLDDLGDADFVKIDVEGAELRVFQGGTNLLQRIRPVLFFECDRNKPEVSALLEGFGYRFFDFETMCAVSQVVHNTLALHPQQHAALLAGL